MTIALILVITAVLCVALAGMIREAPWLFYLLAVSTVLILIAGVYGSIGGNWWKPLILLVRRCTLALALFTVVMYIGVLPKGSKLGMRMRSVRAELSIIAWILCMGHMCLYLAHYFVRAFVIAARPNLLIAFVVAIALFVLLLILGVTSFTFVKRRISARTWKRIQILAYPFFLLVYVHLMLMLAPSALSGGVSGTSASVDIVVYTVVFAAYLVLRLWRYAVDRKAGLFTAGGVSATDQNIGGSGEDASSALA